MITVLSYNFVSEENIQQFLPLLALLKILEKTLMKETMVVTFLLTTKKHLILLNMIFFHQNLNILQWCNLTLAQWFWVTKVCLWMGKISKICLLVAQLGQQLLEKQILKIILDKLWWNDYFKLEFTPFKAEQPLKGMVFQEKEAQIYQYLST